jgi:hypothetical protein
VILELTPEEARLIEQDLEGPGDGDVPVRLPPLLEVCLETEGDAGTFQVSVFAPLVRTGEPFVRQARLDGWYAPPAVQLVDLLLELTGKQPRLRMLPLADGRGFRLVPTREGTPLDLTGARLRLVDAPGVDPVPADWIDQSLQGQWLVRLPPERCGRQIRLEVQWPWKEVEEYRLFLPPIPAQGPPPAVRLTPAEEGSP